MENDFKEVDFDELEEDENSPISDHVVFRDPVVRRVVYKFVDRSNVGYEKYGQTLDSERRQGVKNLGGYLQDIQEELMDAILYIQAAKEELKDKPACKCQVKDVSNKTTIGDLQALQDLKDKMDVRKDSYWDRKEWFKQHKKDQNGSQELYNGDYVSNNT